MEVGDNTNGGDGDEVNVASEGSLVCIKTSEPENHTSSETREREGGREGWREAGRELWDSGCGIHDPLRDG